MSPGLLQKDQECWGGRLWWCPCPTESPILRESRCSLRPATRRTPLAGVEPSVIQGVGRSAEVDLLDGYLPVGPLRLTSNGNSSIFNFCCKAWLATLISAPESRQARTRIPSSPISARMSWLETPFSSKAKKSKDRILSAGLHFGHLLRTYPGSPHP